MTRLLQVSAVVLVGAGLAAAGLYGRNFAGALRDAVRSAVTRKAPAPPVDEEILRQREKDWVAEVSRTYDRIRAEVDRAKASGVKTDFLEPKLTEAMNIARGGRYRDALMMLNLVEVQIPHPAEKITPVTEKTGTSSSKPRIVGAPVKRVKKHKTKHHMTKPQQPQ